jgi:hypothetical protein
VKKSELQRALQTEIQKHNLSTFMSKEHKIVETGCSFCQKHFGTVEQFKRHITEDVYRRYWISCRLRGNETRLQLLAKADSSSPKLLQYR